MWQLNQKIVKDVKVVLDDIGGVCQRCYLRCAGVKNSKLIQEAGEIKDEECPEPASKIAKTLPCRLCIGLLEERYMESAFQSIEKALKEEQYDETHFTVALSLPVSLTLRHHAICLYLATKVPDFDDDDVIPIKQVWKWLFPKRIEKRIGKKFVTGHNCEFYIELQLDFENDEMELGQLQKMCQEEYAERKKQRVKYHMGLVTRVGAEKSLETVPEKVFRTHYQVPPKEPETLLTRKVVLKHDSCFVAGRYNKFSRELPQTPWILDGKKVFETSVEELIASKIKDKMKVDDSRFSSSGREDVDVRMLGRGRPFLFELINPRQVHLSQDELTKMQQSINESTQDVFVRDLQIVSKASINALKEGEDQKKKTYNALCTLPKNQKIEEVKAKLEGIKDLQLAQQTPIRVLHRRPDANRSRTVYFMEVQPLQRLFDQDNQKLFLLKLATQAGTYVKEFVHGDFGRTEPNLAQILGCDVDILALDVEEIDLDWPPRLDKCDEGILT